MRYLVIVHYMRANSHELKTTHRGFDSLESAETFAEEMYNSTGLQEVQALIYELKKSYN